MTWDFELAKLFIYFFTKKGSFLFDYRKDEKIMYLKFNKIVCILYKFMCRYMVSTCQCHFNFYENKHFI